MKLNVSLPQTQSNRSMIAIFILGMLFTMFSTLRVKIPQHSKRM